MERELLLGLATTLLAGTVWQLGRQERRNRVIDRLPGAARWWNHGALLLALAAAAAASWWLAGALQPPVEGALFTLGAHNDPLQAGLAYLFLFLGLALLVYALLSLWWFGGFVLTARPAESSAAATPSQRATAAGTEAVLAQVERGRGGAVLALLGLGCCLFALLLHALLADTYVAATEAGVQVDGFFETDGTTFAWKDLAALEVHRSRDDIDLTWRTHAGAARTIENDGLYGLDAATLERVITVHREHGVRIELR